MSPSLPSFFTGHVDDDTWAPFEYAQDGQMQTFGEFIPVRMAGSAGSTLAVGLWRQTEACSSPVYTSELGDETFLVLEGACTIEVVDTGEKFTYGPGQFGSWSRGTRSIWHFTEVPFRKLFVVAHPDAPPSPE